MLKSISLKQPIQQKEITNNSYKSPLTQIVFLNKSNYYSNSKFTQGLNSMKNNYNYLNKNDTLRFLIKGNNNRNLNGIQLPINCSLQQPYIKKNIPNNKPISSSQKNPFYFPNNNFINPLNNNHNNNIYNYSAYNSKFKK